MHTTSKLLKAAFDPYFVAPLEVWKTFAEHGEVIETSKNEIIKKHDSRERYFYFILKGSGGIMLYKNNNHLCIDLCYEGDFFGDYLSFLTNESTALEVICFEPSTLFRINQTNFRKLAEMEYGKTICRAAAEGLFIHKQTQQIELLTKTAEQRYKDILSKQAHIIQRTPNKHIASYLGITPESLSRIRKNI